jgi:UDP-N-acetylmuramyl pentapeptide synthase
MSEMRPLSKSVNKFYSNLMSKLNQFDDILFAGDYNIYKKYFENVMRVKYIDTTEYEGVALSILKNCRKGDLIIVKGSEKYNLHYFVNKLTHE